MKKIFCYKRKIIVPIMALVFAAFAYADDWAAGFADDAALVVEHEALQAGRGVSGPMVIDAESSQRLGTELSALALATAPFVVVEKSTQVGNGRVRRPKGYEIHQQFGKLTVNPAGDYFSYNVGDTVDILSRGRRVKGSGSTQLRLIERKGRGVVIGFAGQRPVVEVFSMWGAIVGGERIAKAASFTPFYAENLAAPATKVEGRVVMRLENTVLPYLHQHLVIDQGSASGIRVGDFFTVMQRERSNRMSEKVLEAQVVSVSPSTATLLVQKLYQRQIEIGDVAHLSLRAVVDF